MTQLSPLSSGMDGHKDALAGASVATDHDAEGMDLGTRGTRPCDLDQLGRTRQSPAQPLVFVSAAGPCGSWRSRSRTPHDDAGWGVAPARMPHQAGDRVTTDRRDAVPRARLLRSGARTPVDGPTVDAAAIRDRSRARAETRSARKAAQWRLHAGFLRPALRSTGRAHGGPAPWRWRAEVRGPTPAQPLVLPADVRAVPEHTARLQRRAPARHEQVQAGRCAPGGEAVQAVRGVPCTVAVPTGAARGDRTRVDTPRQRTQLLGLIPAADASGARRRQGSGTTAGQTPARRALVEGAWASRAPAHVRRPLPRRLDPPPHALQDIHGQAPVRLGQRARRLLARGTHANQGVVALARARGGLLGAMATQGPGRPSPHRPVQDNATPPCAGFQRASAETQPRGGATLDGVKRPPGRLVPRARQAPDGGQAGGTQPTERSRINRRLFLAPACPMHRGQKNHEDLKKSAANP